MKTIKGGIEPGVWGLELVAIRYAAWIEPKFEIQVYNTFVEAKRKKALAEINRNTARLEYRPLTDAIKHEREAHKKESIRDYLTPEQIHCVTELQCANTVFIGMGWDFEQRKATLMGIFNKNHRQPLIEEQHRLAA